VTGERKNGFRAEQDVRKKDLARDAAPRLGQRGVGHHRQKSYGDSGSGKEISATMRRRFLFITAPNEKGKGKVFRTKRENARKKGGTILRRKEGGTTKRPIPLTTKKQDSRKKKRRFILELIP